MVYAPGDYAEMILLYGRYNYNSARACRQYIAVHPDRDHPTPRVISDAVRRLQRTGSAVPNRKETGRPQTRITPENRERVLEVARRYPEIGLRGIAAQLDLSLYAVQKIMKIERWHAYHPTRVQNIHAGDPEQRLRFCRWILEEHHRDPNFLQTILFSDESKFGNEGIWNFRNFHHWAAENPHLTSVRRFQIRFNIDLWAGIIGNRLVFILLLIKKY